MVTEIVKRVAAGLVLTVAVTAAALAAGSGRLGLAFGDGVPDDLQGLTRATWARFADTFPARRGCLAPVVVAGAWELDDRAAYDPDRRLVTVRIPGTAPNLAATLVHEFAHHLEFTCAAHQVVRPAFLEAQGFPPEASWFEGSAWDRTPSEQFAEATVNAVLGRPAHSLIAVRARALAVIRAWGRGR